LKVSFGPIAIAAFYERLLHRDRTDIDVDARRDAWPSWAEAERGSASGAPDTRTRQGRAHLAVAGTGRCCSPSPTG
jgi:hypothetical protein